MVDLLVVSEAQCAAQLGDNGDDNGEITCHSSGTVGLAAIFVQAALTPGQTTRAD